MILQILMNVKESMTVSNSVKTQLVLIHATVQMDLCWHKMEETVPVIIINSYQN